MQQRHSCTVTILTAEGTAVVVAACCCCSCLAFTEFKGPAAWNDCDLLDPWKLACFCEAGPVDGRLQDGPDMEEAGGL